MKVHIGISRTCDSCGGRIRVLVRKESLTEEEKRVLTQGQGFCQTSVYVEAEINGYPVETSDNP